MQGWWVLEINGGHKMWNSNKKLLVNWGTPGKSSLYTQQYFHEWRDTWQILPLNTTTLSWIWYGMWHATLNNWISYFINIYQDTCCGMDKNIILVTLYDRVIGKLYFANGLYDRVIDTVGFTTNSFDAQLNEVRDIRLYIIVIDGCWFNIYLYRYGIYVNFSLNKFYRYMRRMMHPWEILGYD